MDLTENEIKRLRRIVAALVLGDDLSNSDWKFIDRFIGEEV